MRRRGSIGLPSIPSGSNELCVFKRKPQRIGEYTAIPSRVMSEFDRIGPTKAAQRSSGRRDPGPVELGGDFCAHEFEKDANASSVVKMHKATKGFSKGS
jgi:hypothetical protein